LAWNVHILLDCLLPMLQEHSVLQLQAVAVHPNTGDPMVSLQLSTSNHTAALMHGTCN